MQAPLAPGAATTSQTQANDSEMLMALGYSSSALLAGLVNGWLTMFGLLSRMWW
ncbi:hypothetical protein ACEQUB_02723 [Ralstonia syzygii]